MGEDKTCCRSRFGRSKTKKAGIRESTGFATGGGYYGSPYRCYTKVRCWCYTTGIVGGRVFTGWSGEGKSTREYWKRSSTDTCWNGTGYTGNWYSCRERCNRVTDRGNFIEHSKWSWECRNARRRCVQRATRGKLQWSGSYGWWRAAGNHDEWWGGRQYIRGKWSAGRRWVHAGRATGKWGRIRTEYE